MKAYNSKEEKEQDLKRLQKELAKELKKNGLTKRALFLSATINVTRDHYTY